MAYTLEQGSHGLNAEVVDSMVKQIAAQTYKFKQAVTIEKTSALDNTFFREDPAVLTASGVDNIMSTTYGTAIATAHPKWERLTSRVVTFKLEDNIAWEILKGSVINMEARTIIKITQAVVKRNDDYLWDQLTASQNFAQSFAQQSYSIAAGAYWNGVSASIVNDVAAGLRMIGDKFYDNSNCLLFCSPRDVQSIKKYFHDKGAQYNALGEDMALNGRVSRIAGATIVESPSVTASYALLGAPKICATYKEFVPIQSTTIEDPYKSWTLRVVQEGVLEITDPKALVIIRGTQGTDGL